MRDLVPDFRCSVREESAAGQQGVCCRLVLDRTALIAAWGSGIPQRVHAYAEAWTRDERPPAMAPRVPLHGSGVSAGGLPAGLSIGRHRPAVPAGAGIFAPSLAPGAGTGHDVALRLPTPPPPAAALAADSRGRRR